MFVLRRIVSMVLTALDSLMEEQNAFAGNLVQKTTFLYVGLMVKLILMNAQ